LFDDGDFVTSVLTVSAGSTTQDLPAGTGHGARWTTTGRQGKQSSWSPHEHLQSYLSGSRWATHHGTSAQNRLSKAGIAATFSTGKGGQGDPHPGAALFIFKKEWQAQTLQKVCQLW